MSSQLEKLKREEEELDKQWLGLEEEPKPEEQEEEEQKEEEPQESENSEDADLSNDQESDQVDDTEEAEETQEETQEDPEEKEKEKPKPKRTSWKQRYTNFKTHADVTIRDLRIARSQADSANEDLRGEISKLHQELAALKEQISDGQDPYADVITQEDRDILGEEAVEAMKKIASAGKKTSSAREEALKKELELIRAERSRLIKKEEEDLKADATRALEMAVAKMVPDFESINFDPNFKKYLDKIDPSSGKTNMEFFSMCVKAGDVRGTARFYQDFISQKPKSKEEILKSKITPTGSGASEIVEDKGKKELHNIGDYEKFMDDVSRGLYKGREKEARKLEAMYDRVFVEGRFR